jgi:ABC-type transport system substrate-binding protein
MADPVRIEGYRDFTRLGAGGFAIVYRAYQERFDRIVAVKVLNQTLDGRALRRFERECQATGRLSGHPNVVTVLDSGVTADGLAYMTTELMERGSLGDWIDQHGAMPLADVLQIGVKMCGALTDVHEAGILHRDLKPPNILVSKYGEPALADFGISAVGFADATGNTTSFTPQHTPPEVLEGQTPAITMDVYSLGSTLYHLLNGAPAFDIGNDEALLPFIMRVLNEEVPPLGTDVAPPEVSAVLARAMAKKAADRYQTAEELGRALQELQVFLGHPVTPMAATGPGAAAGDGAAAIPSLLLPTFQPTLSPTVSAPASTSKRTGLFVGAAIVVVLALAGIGLAISRGGSGTVDASKPGGPGSTNLDGAAPAVPLVNPAPSTPGGRLVVGLGTDAEKIDPVQVTTAAAAAISTTVYEPLIRQRGTGFDPVLAATLPTPNGDYTSWTVPIRDGVTFHDGKMLDASMVKAVLDANRNGPAGDNLRNIAAVTATDPRTLTITMVKPWPSYLATLSNILVFSPTSDGTTPAGSGPFTVSAPLTATGVTVHRNERYWGPAKAFVDEIEFRLIAREQERVNAFDRGEIDVILTGNNSTVAHETPRAGAVLQRDAMIDYLVLQTLQSPTVDPAVREAIGLAIDRQALTAGDNARSRATESYMAAGSRWYPKATGAAQHDADKARQLITAYREDHGGGPVTVAVTTVVNSDVADLFPILQSQMKDVGITLSFNAKETRALTVDTLAGNFQAVLASTALPADPDFLNIFFHSQGDSVVNFNLSRFASPELDAALDTSRTSAEDAERSAAFATVTQTLNGAGAYQFLVTRPYALIANSKVTGVNDALADNLFRGGATPWCLALGVEH